MNWKPYVAAAMLFLGCGLLPLGWMFSQKIWLISFALILGGSVLLTLAYKEAEAGDTYMFSGLKRPTGREVPGDIHDHSGWGSGGRSTSWESGNHGSGDAVSGDGD